MFLKLIMKLKGLTTSLFSLLHYFVKLGIPPKFQIYSKSLKTEVPFQACKVTCWPEFDPQDLHGGKRMGFYKLSSDLHTCLVCACVHTNTQNKCNCKNEI